MKTSDVVMRLENELGKSHLQGHKLRFHNCPFCKNYHSNPAFSVDLEKEVFYCHDPDCNRGGHVSELIGKHPFDTRKECNEKTSCEDRGFLFGSFSIAGEGSKSYCYLNSRGITNETINLLEVKLRESNQYGICIYPFISKDYRLVAFQTLRIKEDNQRERRYHGKKGDGVSILRNGQAIIISEGLETGLSVLQHLGEEYGLAVCGDANGIKRLSNQNNWFLKNFKKVIIAADNDINKVGLNAAREVLKKHPKKIEIRLPFSPGTDWNNVLVSRRMEKEWL